MKSKKSGKNSKDNAPEDKKPPTKQISQIEKGDQNQENHPEITEEIEKKMLEGQEHIENVQQEPGSEQQGVNESTKESPKKQILIKPRETYLQDKISKMNYNKNLMTNIQKELGDKVKTIIKDENVLITQVPKDLNKYIKKEIAKSERNVNENYLNKQKYKEVKKLNDELTGLKKNLNQLEQNEKLLQDEGFVQLNSSQKGYAQNTMFDKSIKDQQLKSIQDKKEKLTEKIKSIEFQIKCIMEEHKELSNKEKMKLFIDNFERDKEIVEIRAKKYFKESKERGQRMQNDINNIIEKRKKEMEEKDKNEKKERDEIIKKFKEQEKAIEQKQSKLNEEILLKYKPYINQKLEKTKKNYLYNKRYENYIKREEKYIKDENNKKQKEKDKYNYKFEDIEKFAVEYDEKLENRKYDQEQKSMELSQKWAKNRESLPKSNYQISIPEEKEKNKKQIFEEENSDPEFKTYFQKIGKDIRESYMPEIDLKKKKEREAIIFSLENPTNMMKNNRYTLKKQKKKRVLLKKRDTSKPSSKFKWDLKLVEENENNKIDTINKNLIHKPKKINLMPITRKTTEIPDKKPDYLKEMITKREQKNKKRAMSSNEKGNNNDELLDINKKSKKWEKEINKDGNLIENIKDIQEKAQIIEQEAEMKEKLLQLNGGIENNPELGKKVSSLLIDSIEAKINILKKMNNV